MLLLFVLDMARRARTIRETSGALKRQRTGLGSLDGLQECLGALAEAGEAVCGSSWPPGRAEGSLSRHCSVDIGRKSLGVEQLEGFSRILH